MQLKRDLELEYALSPQKLRNELLVLFLRIVNKLLQQVVDAGKDSHEREERMRQQQFEFEFEMMKAQNAIKKRKKNE